MAKKKTVLIEEEHEKFVIPQIDFATTGLIKRKNGFQKSKVASPFHGSHVLDKNHFVDNKGSVNVDSNYDFVREDKHISDEELIKIHGTKYYEFGFITKDSENIGTLYGGSDYSKPEVGFQPKKEEKKTFSFVSSVDDMLADEEPIINVHEVNDEPDYDNPESEFKLNIDIDDDAPAYEYNTYHEKMPKPGQTNIPSFLTDSANTARKPSFENITIDEELSFGNNDDLEAPAIEFDNPAVDRNQTIEEAILAMQKQEIKYEEKPKPVYNPAPSAPAKQEVEESYGNDYSNYRIPYESIFRKNASVVDENPAWLEEKKEIINSSLRSFGIEGEVVTYTKGPAFTRYEILLASGVNVKKVTQIYDNLQKDLQAKSLRILAPIPGKNTIGVEVPNDVPEMVAFGDIITPEYINNGKPLSVAMGKNIDGTPVFQNITDMPHALIAGATQSGKSVSINTILISLLIKNSPDNLKLILVDPKKVELSFYNDLPHLATPVIDDAQIATESLKWAVAEMERRYDVLARNRVRNIGDFNKKRESNPTLEKLPYIVIVVDEFNDLVMQCGAEANEAIIRLAQKARACGMHIILATQRPTVDVVNGTIKANITCRIAFRVASDMDSRTILDEIGAESLLGRGDMLIKNNGTPLRAQGAYISDDEIEAVCNYLVEKYDSDFLFTHTDLKKRMAKNQAGGGFGVKEAPSEPEELLYQIAEACVSQGVCSINSIQNGFGVGFNRAQRIVQILEERGIVSEKKGTKGREILVDSYKLREIFNMDEE